MEANKDSMAQLSETFNLKLAEFEERQRSASASKSPSDSGLIAEFKLFKSFTLDSLRALQSQVDLLARQHDNLEMHSRRKILLFHGVPEVKGEDIVAVVSKLVVQSLSLSNFQPSDISRCHRMGKSASSDRPRPILCKIRDVSLRAKMWASKKNLRGSGVTMSEFLTKVRHDTFMEARKRFGVSSCWTWDGSVIVLGPGGSRHRVYSLADLDKLGIPTEVAAVAGGAMERAKPSAAVLGGSPGIARAPTAGERPSRRVPKLKIQK